jgi:hypothetical protein
LRSAPLAALLAAAALGPAGAQQLTATEISAGAIAALSARDFWGAAAGLGRRVDNQARVAGVAAVGLLGNHAGVRLETSAQLIINPSGRGGAGLYAGAGVLWQGARGVRGSGYVTALVGLESAPGARRGWYAEVGLGGGVRLALGRRWRRFPPWWR